MTAPLLEVERLAVHFPTAGGLVRAVEEVSLTIERGETLGLVGESGCGKSTLGKALIGLNRPTAGEIRLDGSEIGQLQRHERRRHARRIQMIFQDPFGSLNPRSTVGRIIEEPMIVHRLSARGSRRTRVGELLERVGLSSEAARRYPHEFSGGQRQRVGIARALAAKPDILVCDEPVSALDLSVQAQILNLLRALQRDFGLAMIFISHDLAVVEYIADRVLVMYLGRIVEAAPADALWQLPLHPYSRALMDAAPVIERTLQRQSQTAMIEGDIPSAIDVLPGCAFASRCPHALPSCAETAPPLRKYGPGHRAACHRLDDEAGRLTLAGEVLA
ncbi:MAG: oligopeptide/dipeptide ABC transporter ATP-binding protein [Pseudomonadota bacterium]